MRNFITPVSRGIRSIAVLSSSVVFLFFLSSGRVNGAEFGPARPLLAQLPPLPELPKLPPLPGAGEPAAPAPQRPNEPESPLPPLEVPTADAPLAPTPVGPDASILITNSSVGLVKRGMTIREVKQVMSSATFSRIIGPFDEPTLSVSEGETDLFDIYPAKETDSPTGADTKAGILHVLDSRFQTREGVSIGMALSEITSIYGRVQQIDHDPGSGAEWVNFEAQPKGLKFTIHGGGEPGALTGIYEEGETITADYAVDSKLSSIVIFGLEASEVCNIAGIMIGDDDSVINTAIEVHGFGKLEKGGKTLPNPDDYGSVLQTWNFPDAGISLQTMYYDDGSGGVRSLRMYGNSVQRTGLGVGIGTDKAAAISAYSAVRNDFSPEQEQEYAGHDVLLLGTPGYGMVIHFSDGKVTEILLGEEGDIQEDPGESATSSHDEVIAHYPLTQDGIDETGNNPEMIILESLFQDGGIYSNGGYQVNSVETQTISDLNWKNFEVSVDFKVSEFPESTMSVFVIGGSYRNFAFDIEPDQTVSLNLKNGQKVSNSAQTYSLNKWHRAAISVADGKATLYLDRKLIVSEKYKVVKGTPDFDRMVTNQDYGGSGAFKGLWRDLMIKK